MSDLILVALIAGISSLVGGFIAAALRPWGEDWVARRRESRIADRERTQQRRGALDNPWRNIADATHHAGSRMVLPVHIAEIGDPELDEHVRQLLAASDPGERDAAQGDALRRVGVLMRET